MNTSFLTTARAVKLYHMHLLSRSMPTLVHLIIYPHRRCQILPDVHVYTPIQHTGSIWVDMLQAGLPHAWS